MKNRGSSAGQNPARGLTGGWGKVVGKHHIVERYTGGGFGWSWDGRWWLAGEEQRPAPMSNGGGGAPTALGGGGRAWKD